jgi:hypothetical protein
VGFLSHLFFPWGILLQIVAAVHFFRRRPDQFWFYIIIFLGPLGALVYLFAEALPDLGLLGNTYRGFSRRRRIAELQAAVIDNPSTGNYEELGDLYMDEGQLALARGAYDRSIAARASTIDPFYHRGVCALLLGDAPAAVPDLERTVNKDPGHDFYRAAGLLAHAYALTGQPALAEQWFRLATDRSTASETYLNYAEMLASAGRTAEARTWAQRVMDKKRTSPGYLRRRERPLYRRAAKLLKSLPA